MSNSTRQEITCEFSQPNGVFKLNDDINGKIIVQPFSHISFYQVVFEIYWSITNGSKKEETLLKKQIYNSQRKYWMSGKRYELAFSFKSQAPLSFSSGNFKIERYLKVRVFKHEQGWSFGNNHPDYQLSRTFPFELQPSPNAYTIEKTATNINYGDFLPYLALPIGIGILGGLKGLLLMDFLSAGIFGGGLYYTFVHFGKIGKIEMAISPFDDTSFQVQLNIQRNWSSISKIELTHHISYFNRLGSSSNINYIPLKRLRYQEISNIKTSEVKAIRSYPSIGLPPSITTRYFDILWEFKLTIHLDNNKKKSIDLNTKMDIAAQ